MPTSLPSTLLVFSLIYNSYRPYISSIHIEKAEGNIAAGSTDGRLQIHSPLGLVHQAVVNSNYNNEKYPEKFSDEQISKSEFEPLYLPEPLLSIDTY